MAPEFIILLHLCCLRTDSAIPIIHARYMIQFGVDDAVVVGWIVDSQSIFICIGNFENKEPRGSKQGRMRRCRVREKFLSGVHSLRGSIEPVSMLSGGRTGLEFRVNLSFVKYFMLKYHDFYCGSEPLNMYDFIKLTRIKKCATFNLAD